MLLAVQRRAEHVEVLFEMLGAIAPQETSDRRNSFHLVDH
jgi:hypothetical protein